MTASCSFDDHDVGAAGRQRASMVEWLLVHAS
jgi:hypothetical protein